MRHVALLIESSSSYGRGLLRGVARHNREHGQWSTYFQPQGLGSLLPSWLKNWKGDGILARVDGEEMATTLENTGLPVVNLRNAKGNPRFPLVCLDNRTVAQLAFEHLRQRGFRHFGFCGNARGIHQMLDMRGDEFRRFIQESGLECSVFVPPTVADGRKGKPATWEQSQQQLADWIRSLPKPVGVMASNDERGLMLLDACRRCSCNVPEEVAVVGVDNDEYLCDLSVPPLTSIDVNAEQIGRTAAELLDRLMSGDHAPESPVVLPPRAIVTRRSTDVLASEDPAVNVAVAFIRDHAVQGLQVPDVTAHVRMSRAALEPRIKRILGRTIHQEIQRVQLDRVKAMLVHSSSPLKLVARETGFSCVQYMVRVFRQNTNETPGKYRARRRHLGELTR
jgi:LacI family transcriptional regulator